MVAVAGISNAIEINPLLLYWFNMDIQGLSRDQVVIQREKYGENRLPDREKKSIIKFTYRRSYIN